MQKNASLVLSVIHQPIFFVLLQPTTSTPTFVSTKLLTSPTKTIKRKKQFMRRVLIEERA